MGSRSPIFQQAAWKISGERLKLQLRRGPGWSEILGCTAQAYCICLVGKEVAQQPMCPLLCSSVNVTSEQRENRDGDETSLNSGNGNRSEGGGGGRLYKEIQKEGIKGLVIFVGIQEQRHCFLVFSN